MPELLSRSVSSRNGATQRAVPSRNGKAPHRLPGFDHGQRRNTVAQMLLSEIFQGRLPAGKHLVIQELAERFDVSPTPIREALLTLEGIGIVEFAPNRGAVVRRVTKSDVRDVCQVRRALECEATRAACGRIDLAELNDLADEFRKMQASKRRGVAFVENARRLDSRLHDLIAESCGNRFLAKEIGRLKLLFRTFRDVAWEHNQANHEHLRFVEEAREHLAIVEPLLAGDGKSAAAAMSRHIRAGLKYWSRAVPA